MTERDNTAPAGLFLPLIERVERAIEKLQEGQERILDRLSRLDDHERRIADAEGRLSTLERERVQRDRRETADCERRRIRARVLAGVGGVLALLVTLHDHVLRSLEWLWGRLVR